MLAAPARSTRVDRRATKGQVRRGMVGHGSVLSLFTGAGGLDCGLEAAGLETIACIENDSACARTLEENRPSWKLLDCSDVVEAAKTLTPAKDRPSWTLPANPGPATGPFHWDNRPLSARERMRLQSFPDDWHVVGKPRERTRQIGNATPPLLAEVVGRALVEQILAPGYGYQNPAVLLRPRARRTPRPRPPMAVPDRFRHVVGPKDAHNGPGRGPSPRPS